jgi:Acetyltransferase (GNAT) domain
MIRHVSDGASAPAIETPTTSYCLFQEPWWLNLAGAGHWDEAVVSDAAGVVARLPYRRLRRHGAVILTQPHLTPYAGPWFRSSAARASREFSGRRQLTAELLARLPRYDLFSQNLWPALPDWLPFCWEGFTQSTAYTHWLRDLSDTERLWAGLLEATRRQIRKARRQLEVVVADDVERLCELHELTFRQQGLSPPRERALVRRIVEGALRAGHARIAFAVDEARNAHAVNLLVFDQRSAHYLLGGSDARHRGSGAASLLMWDAIEFAARVSRMFDFEGSMVEGIARFFRGFNPETVPVLHVYRASRRAAFAGALYNAGAALVGRPPLRL